MRACLRALVAAGVLSALASAAQPGERPWASGVSAERQHESLQLFLAANELFEQSKYAQALALYRDALKVWDHPGIRYNAAVCLINLDQPLQAFENLELALRHGEAPFDPETFKQAQLYRKLLAGQVAELEVRCLEPEAEVVLDGERLFVGPGTLRRRLPPGPHQLVARKPGFVTETEALQLEPGKLHEEALTLHVPLEAPITLVRRWPVWLPWTVLGAGAVVAAIGGPVLASAQSQLDRFDSDLAQLCPSGCAEAGLPQTVRSGRDGARVANGAAIGLFAVGGALVVTGVVLVAMNGLHPEGGAPALSLSPVLGPGGLVGLSGALRF